MHEPPFPIRAYCKIELALLYNPSPNVEASRRTLVRWIQRNHELVKELETAGYNKFRKVFTPREVEVIVKHLGVP